MAIRSDNDIQYNVAAKTYFLFAFSWSCLFWFATVYSGGIQEFPGSLLQYVGGAGPIVAALILVFFGEGRSQWRSFWVRTFDVRLIPMRWLLVALLIHPLLVGVASFLDMGLGGQIETKTTNLTTMSAWITMVVLVFVLGPLPEEMGWRGVALDRLQAAMSPLRASLLLGSLWSIWHLPLFAIQGTFQNQLVLGSPRFWIFLTTMVPLSVIITWVYNNCNRSILSAVLIHFTGNLCGALLVKTDQLAALELVALTVAAVVICWRWPQLGFAPAPTASPALIPKL